jgi:hypothetical protein
LNSGVGFNIQLVFLARNSLDVDDHDWKMMFDWVRSLP